MADTQRFLTGLMSTVIADFERQAKESKYFDDVTLWAKDVLGLDLWYKQTEVADALHQGDFKSIAVKAGHGVGKSFLAAVLVCHWIATRPIQYTFVASTAPSADQVSAILWREIRGMHTLSHKRFKEGLIDAPLPGYITMDNKWRDDLGNLIAQGRKPPDHAEDSFQGIHAQYVLAIGDEACGLNENMIDSLANITSNEKSRRLLIANPTNPRSRLGEIFSNSPDDKGVIVGQAWSQHSISVLDSPNFHGGDWCDPTCPLIQEHRLLPRGLGLSKQALESLTGRSYVVEKQLEYGIDSARYKARVLGEFAYDSGNNLFDDITMARGKDSECYVSYDQGTVVHLGFDVARSAHGDTSYLYSFTSGQMHEWVEKEETDGEDTVRTIELGGVGNIAGGQLRFVAKYRGIPLVDTFDEKGVFVVGQATLVHQHAINLNATEIRIDSGGMGVGLIDGINLLAKGKYRVVAMQSGGPTPDARFWVNNRAFQFDQMKKRMGNGLIDIDPTDRTLVNQLEDILYEFDGPHSAMKIESKDSMKKRGVKSPDAADAGWYACADLRHLDGPQDGDVVTKTPDEILEDALATSGFYGNYRW